MLTDPNCSWCGGYILNGECVRCRKLAPPRLSEHGTVRYADETLDEPPTDEEYDFDLEALAPMYDDPVEDDWHGGNWDMLPELWDDDPQEDGDA